VTTGESMRDGEPDRVPRPDPTTLTTQQLLREMNALKELVSVQLGALATATNLQRETMEAAHNALRDQIIHLRELHSERFESIDKQFLERDVRVEQTARDTKVAVDAALQAAEKAANAQYQSFAQSIDKSETATAKQIDALNAALQAATAALDAKINDGKDRLTRIESYGIGRVETNKETQGNNSMTISIIGGLVGIGGLVLGLVVALSR